MSSDINNTPQHTDFNHQLIVITGAAQGIGAALSETLLNKGARVVLIDIDEEALEQQFQKLWQQYPKNHTDKKDHIFRYCLDLCNNDQVQACVQSIEHHCGAIDALACVAGILHPGTLLDLKESEWLATFDLNVHGNYYLCRAVASVMRPRQQGAIVAVGSNAARVPRAGMAAYCASKAALSSLIKCLGLELAADNIRCNIVSPGSTNTAMQTQLLQHAEHPVDRDKFINSVIQGNLATYRGGIPLRRIAEPNAIADSIVFLLSPQARHITLQDLVVDGGAILGC